MSILTRVMIVSLLVLSLVYLGMTAALFSYRVDYKERLKEEISAHQKTIKDKDLKIEDLLGKKGALEKDISQLEKEISTLKTDLNAAQNDLTSWKEENTRVTNEFTKLSETYKKLEAELNEQIRKNEEFLKTVEDFRKRKDDAEKDRATFESKFMQTQDDLSKIEKNLAALEQQYLVQAKELNSAKTLLEQYKKAVPALAGEQNQAKWIEGKILAVSDKPDLNLVVMSVGKNDGVEAGMKFTVYRVDKYVGKIQVEKVEPQISSAFSIKEFQSDGIKVGDSITTSPY
ncbi:MAG: hypothetical protein WC980_01400 [Candidatus Brocadiia bacterium]